MVFSERMKEFFEMPTLLSCLALFVINQIWTWKWQEIHSVSYSVDIQRW